MAYTLRNCSEPQLTLLADDSIQGYVGRIVVLDGFPGICYEVLDVQTEDPGTAYEVVDCFFTCEDCARTAYLLTDCTGRLQPIYSTQDDLEDHVGSIIKVPYYDNACFSVSLIPYDNTQTHYVVDFSNVYASCVACAHRKTVEPFIPTFLCDTKEVEKVFDKMGNIYYQEVAEKRFGVTFCCKEDFTKWFIKMRNLELLMMKHPSPDLPEPVVLFCCITTDQPCTNNCNPCQQEEEISECPCNCQASENSPHDCHTYTFEITSDMIGNATGNDTGEMNDHVFFGYFPCGQTEAVTLSYGLADVGVKELCVLGTPIFGWYVNNVWTNYDSIVGPYLTRGDVCEEENETENNCNTCNQ